MGRNRPRNRAPTPWGGETARAPRRFLAPIATSPEKRSFRRRARAFCRWRNALARQIQDARCDARCGGAEGQGPAETRSPRRPIRRLLGVTGYCGEGRRPGRIQGPPLRGAAPARRHNRGAPASSRLVSPTHSVSPAPDRGRMAPMLAETSTSPAPLSGAISKI